MRCMNAKPSVGTHEVNIILLSFYCAVRMLQDHALAAVGPIYELPDYNWIRRRSYWLRY
jgi:hypothetical protein